MGCCQAGFVSAFRAARSNREISDLVLFYPAFCIPDEARKGKMLWARFDPENIPQILHGGPITLGRIYAQDAAALGPYAEISGYDGNVLIVHGTADKVVPIDYSHRACILYRGEPFERIVTMQELKGGRHGFFGRKDAEAMDYLRAFLQQTRENAG